jgi:hypothetical protein
MEQHSITEQDLQDVIGGADNRTTNSIALGSTVTAGLTAAAIGIPAYRKVGALKTEISGLKNQIDFARQEISRVQGIRS